MRTRVACLLTRPFTLAFFFADLCAAEEALPLEQAAQEARETSPEYLRTVAEADAAPARKLELVLGHPI